MQSAGTIQKRQKNKDGTTSYRILVQVDGRRYTKTVKCHTAKEADKERIKFYLECQEHRIDYSNISWEELCDEWLENYAAITYKKSTYDTAVRLIRYRVKDAFAKQARKITRKDVQSWVNSMDDISPKSVRNYYAICRSIFKWAVQKELLTDSPCKYIDMPRKQKKEAQYLSKDDLPSLLNALESAELKYKASLYLALFAGLRKGEILALEWSDVNLDTGEYKITKNRQVKIGGGSYTDTPKSVAGNRKGVLPQNAVKVLIEFKAFQEECRVGYADLYHENNLIIKHDDGTPISPSTLGKWVIKFRERNNLPEFSMHSLRHTHATIMRYLGADIDEIQKKLGHSDKSTTQNIYVHMFESFEEADRRTADKINDFVNKL